MRGVPTGVLFALAGCDVVFGLQPVQTLPGDGAMCSRGGAFGTGVPVPIDGNYSVEGARFNPSQSLAYLSLCPASGLKSGCDLYQSSYNVPSQSFGSFAKLTGVSGPSYDAYPTVTPDGRHILFGSDRTGFVNVFVATAVNGSFDNPVIKELSLVPGAGVGNEPYILGDGETLYLSAVKGNDSQLADLYRAHGAPPDFGGTASPVPGVNTTSYELAPVVSDDELEIFFASDLTTGVEFALDIYTATRDSSSQPFRKPSLVGALSTSGIDWPLWLSPTGCDLYYINKVTSVATLYVTHRAP